MTMTFAGETGSQHQRKLLYDKYVRYLFIACASLMTVVILSIIVFIGQQGLMTFKDVSPLEFFFAAKWDPTAEKFGALSFITGSIYVTILAVLLGGPLGLAGAVFMAKIAPQWLRNLMRPATDLYVAVPSVVYGFVGLTMLVPFNPRTFSGANRFWPAVGRNYSGDYDFADHYQHFRRRHSFGAADFGGGVAGLGRHALADHLQGADSGGVTGHSDFGHFGHGPGGG